CSEISADGRRVADLRRANRARRLDERRRANVVLEHPRVRDERAHVHVAVPREGLEFLDAIDRDDVARPQPSEVDLHREGGPAGEDRRIGAPGKILEGIVEVSGNVNAHAGIITSGLIRRSLDLPREWRPALGGSADLEQELAESRATGTAPA